MDEANPRKERGEFYYRVRGWRFFGEVFCLYHLKNGGGVGGEHQQNIFRKGL